MNTIGFNIGGSQASASPSPGPAPKETRWPARPETGRYTDGPIRSFTDFDSVDMVKHALRQLENGLFTMPALLADFMTRDDRIASGLDTRINGVLGLPLEFEEGGDKRRSQKIADACGDDWETMFPEAQTYQLLFWGLALGAAIGELVWEQGDRWVPKLKVWHPQFYYWRWDTRSFWVVTIEGPVEVKEGDGKWVLFTPYGRENGWMKGLIRRLALPWLIRQWAFRDWARYSEVHGLPIRKAKVPSNADEADKNTFLAQVANLGSESSLTLPQGERTDEPNFDLELVEAKADTWQGFEKLLEKCESSIAIAILGQNLTTEVRGGSMAAARVHDRVRQDYMEADVKTLMTCLKAQVIAHWARFNFGSDDLAPTPKLDTQPPDDEVQTSQSLFNLAQALQTFRNAQAPIDARALCDEYGLPLLPEGAPIPGTEAPPVAPGNQPPGPGDAPAGSGAGVQPPAQAAPGAPAASPPPVKASLVALASGDRPTDASGFVKGQLYVDGVADEGRAAIAKVLRPDVDALLRAIDEAEDYDDLRARLVTAYKGMDPGKLSDLMAQAHVLAELAGRFAVNEDL